MLYFEHWLAGQFMKYIVVKAGTVAEAISKLSDNYKGVFRLVSEQEMHEPMKGQLVGEL